MYFTINNFTLSRDRVIFEEDACKLWLYFHVLKASKTDNFDKLSMEEWDGVKHVTFFHCQSIVTTEVTEQIEWSEPGPRSGRFIPEK